MGCLNCGKKNKGNAKVDKHGNKLKNYAYLRPEQLGLLKQQEALEEQQSNKENK
jgi:hypothetical protein